MLNIKALLTKILTNVNTLNGSVGKLTGTSIPNNANLNTYNTVGAYYTSSNAAASSLVNKPSDLSVSFSMLVMNKGGYNIQVIFTNGGNIYVRGQTTSAWQGWVKFSGSSV